MKVYQIDSNQVDLSFFQELHILASKNEDDYEKFLKQLDGNRIIYGIGPMLEEEFPLGYQSVGNCSMACLEGSVWAFVVLNKLFGTPQGTFNDKLKPNQSIIERALDYTTEEVCDWLFYHQIYHVERYIGTRLLRSRDPKKIERSKEERKRIEMDYDLYMNSMDSLAGQLELRKHSKTRVRSRDKAFEIAIVALINGLSNVLKA